eukprot:686901-Prorocentrum_minimum.AAC.4
MAAPSPGVGAGSQLAQGLRTRTQLIHREREVQRGPDVSHNRTTGDVRATKTGVQDGSFGARVSAHQQHGVSLLYTQDCRIHQVASADVRIQCGETLAAVVAAAQLVEQVLQRNDALRVSELTSNCLHLVAGNVAHGSRDGSEGILPGSERQAVLALDHGRVETLALKAIILEACLVRDPLLVHLLVQPRGDAHHLRALGVDADGSAQGIGNIHRLGELQFPGAGRERVGLGGKCTDRAKVDDVSRHVARQ